MFLEYFGHFLVFRGILLTFKVLGFFFFFSRVFWSFLGFGGISVIL